MCQISMVSRLIPFLLVFMNQKVKKHVLSCWRCNAYHAADECPLRVTSVARDTWPGYAGRVALSGKGTHTPRDSDNGEENGKTCSTPWLLAVQLTETLCDRSTPLCSSCMGPLPVLGRIPTRVQRGQTTVRSVLVIADCGGPLLCGRITIKAFHDASALLLEVRMLSYVNFLCGNTLVQEMLDVFGYLQKETACSICTVGRWPRLRFRQSDQRLPNTGGTCI